MKKYNVIWFDDEFLTLDIIKENALLNGVILHGFSNSKEGISELERNIINYDAAIVDGKFLKDPNQEKDTIDDSALFDVAITLEKYSTTKVLPWFILSGQPSFTKEKNRYADGFKNNVVYDKLNEEHQAKLWEDLKEAANQQKDTQIRHKYQRVFDICSEKYIGVNANKHLLSVLKKENSENAFSDPELYFNPLRKIVDDLFIACNKIGLLPDVFVKPNVALNESSKFLSGGIERSYKCEVATLPKVVSDNLHNILAVCQPASHRAEIDTFIKQVNSPYLLFSITYQLLDVLLWFKDYVDSHGNIESNKANIKAVDSGFDTNIVIGIVEKDFNRNFHCDEIILTYKLINDMGFKEGDKIKILKTALNTNEKTMHLYTKSAILTEKL